MHIPMQVKRMLMVCIMIVSEDGIGYAITISRSTKLSKTSNNDNPSKQKIEKNHAKLHMVEYTHLAGEG